MIIVVKATFLILVQGNTAKNAMPNIACMPVGKYYNQSRILSLTEECSFRKCYDIWINRNHKKGTKQSIHWNCFFFLFFFCETNHTLGPPFLLTSMVLTYFDKYRHRKVSRAKIPNKTWKRAKVVTFKIENLDSLWKTFYWKGRLKKVHFEIALPIYAL